MSVNDVSKYQNGRARTWVIISLGLVLLAGIIVAVWLLFFNGATLKQYSNNDSGYSISVPSSYIVAGSGNNVSFYQPTTNENQNTSSIKITTSSVTIPADQTLETEIADFDSYLANVITTTNARTTPDRMSNMVVNKSTQGDLTVWVQTADIFVSDSLVGKYRKATFLSSSEMYAVEIIAYSSEPFLSANLIKITDSFAVK